MKKLLIKQIGGYKRVIISNLEILPVIGYRMKRILTNSGATISRVTS